MDLLKVFSKGGKGLADGVPLTEDAFREMVFFLEDREMRSLLPDLSGKMALEISPRQKPALNLLKGKGAGFVGLLGGTKEKELAAAMDPESAFVFARQESLPFVDGGWNFALLRTTFLKGSLGKALREVARVLNSKGSVFLSDLHPYSLAAQKESLKTVTSESNQEPTGFEGYFKNFQEADLEMELVRELFYEGTLKKFFASDEEKKAFDALRKTPLLIQFLLKKKS